MCSHHNKGSSLAHCVPLSVQEKSVANRCLRWRDRSQKTKQPRRCWWGMAMKQYRGQDVVAVLPVCLDKWASSVRVGLVLGALHLSQTHDFFTNGVLDPKPSNLDVFPTSRSGAHPDRCRGVRLDIYIDGSHHLFVHVLREDSSCWAIHDCVEFCFSRTEGSNLVACNPWILKKSSVEFKSCMSGATFLAASAVWIKENAHGVSVLLMIKSERKLLRSYEILDGLATRKLPIFRGFDIISLSLFTQNRRSNRPLDT